MAFKFNVSNNGRTLKYETENEELIGIKISDKIDGKMISDDLAGYELEIKGTSDKAGFPGMDNLQGPALRRVLLTRGKAMKNTTKGLRLRKTVRGNEISADTIQINTIVIKEGKAKFSTLGIKTEEKKE